MPTTQDRQLQALAMRDAGNTFAQIATALGYNDAANARYAWIGGLRLAGRNAEIPQRQSRTVRISNGRTTTTVVTADMQGHSTNHFYSFGIEIECVGINESMANTVLNNGGVACVANGYTHAVMPTWKVVHDGSLSSRNGSCEVVSPVLRGQDGLNAVRTVMKLLREAGATVNASCGMHIHIGMDTVSREGQAAVIRSHAYWNAAFDAYIPSRRCDNSYATKRRYRIAEQLADNWTNPDADRSYISRNEGRYYTLNVNSFHKYGTFEFRMHHGSLNGLNATAWVALHHGFVAAAAAGDLPDIAMHTHGNDYNEWTEGHRNGNTVARELQVKLAHILVAHLATRGYITIECANHLTQRAGNLPTRNA